MSSRTVSDNGVARVLMSPYILSNRNCNKLRYIEPKFSHIADYTVHLKFTWLTSWRIAGIGYEKLVLMKQN